MVQPFLMHVLFDVDQRVGTGVRLPQEVRVQLRAMIETGVTVPSLSHYVQYLCQMTFISSTKLTFHIGSSMLGELATTLHRLIACIATLITPCTIATVRFTNTHS